MRFQRIPIKRLKITGEEAGKVIAGTVVQKSGLRTYDTKKKERKVFFTLGLADETGTIKVMVYGKERFKKLNEDASYIFKKVIVDRQKNIVKLTKRSKTSKTSSIAVPEDLQLEARVLIYRQSLFSSIRNTRTVPDKTCVSVEGTVTEVRPTGSQKVLFLTEQKRLSSLK